MYLQTDCMPLILEETRNWVGRGYRSQRHLEKFPTCRTHPTIWMQEEIITEEESSFNQTLVKGIERFKKAAAEVKDVVLGAQCVSTTIMKHTSYGSRGNCRVAKPQDPTNRGQGQIYMASGPSCLCKSNLQWCWVSRYNIRT